jgi:hypothetical protein
MRKPDAYRMDYQPGPKALKAIEDVMNKEPNLNQQAILDKLVIYGGWAMEHVKLAPPPLFGTDRRRWR